MLHEKVNFNRKIVHFLKDSSVNLLPKDTTHPQRKTLSGKVPSACGMQTNIPHHLDPLPNRRNDIFIMKNNNKKKVRKKEMGF